MILDSEAQRNLLLQAINQTTVQGAQAKVLVAMKDQLHDAEIKTPDGGCPVQSAVDELSRREQPR